MHPSGDMDSVVNGTIRAAFEYSGQKCSACSRIYVPRSKWAEVKAGLLAVHSKLKLGSPLEADTFLSAVIDAKVSVSINIPHPDHELNRPYSRHDEQKARLGWQIYRKFARQYVNSNETSLLLHVPVT